MAARIKKGDKVLVMVGKSKGHKGEVTFFNKAKNKVIVSGANTFIKHVKPSASNPEGGRVPIESLIHVSNVSIIDPKDGIATRIGFKIGEDSKKYRYAKRSGEKIE